MKIDELSQVPKTFLDMEQRIEHLEKEKADLKRQLGDRQNIPYENEFCDRVGNFSVYLKVAVCEAPDFIRKDEYADKEIVFKTFGDYFENAGLLTAQLVFESIIKEHN